jgi:hypothetical protein
LAVPDDLLEADYLYRHRLIPPCWC